MTDIAKSVRSALDAAYIGGWFKIGQPLRALTVRGLANDLVTLDADLEGLEPETILSDVKEWCDENDVYIYGTTERRPE